MEDHDTKSSRIAIDLGKPSASAHGIKPRSRPAHTKRHRAHALHEESESEDNSDNDQKSYGRHETITTFDLLGASRDDEKARKREVDSKHHKEEGAPAKGKEREQESRRDGSAADSAEAEDKTVKWGLTINMKGAKTRNGRRERESKSHTEHSESEGDLRAGKKTKRTIDDEALDALMGTNKPKRRHLDSEAADRDPRLEDYRSIPIDDFGATLLKGFGWDGKLRGKVKEVTRHANLTGLGAKDAKGAEDLGAWNQKTAKDSRPVRLEDYNREERKKRERADDKYVDSYKRERERERERERDRGRHR
ncbi:hypothetical protein N0V88_005761 [Collariella sp. IMI 366227]|nr:hypothetical protein N0V88_005761 [Collariella sp. IMI 366227]